MKKIYRSISAVAALVLGIGASWGQTTYNYTGAVETYTVPAGVSSIRIEAAGGQGGNSGGLGAIMIGDFSVTPGQQFQIMVGQEGQMAATTRAGGGGGTFVADISNQPVICAGGGGGLAWDGTGSPSFPGIDANTTENGNNGYSLENGLGTTWDENYGVGGTGGDGSTLPGPDGFGHAGNGAGFYTDGADGICGLGGDSFLNGGAGGTGCSGGPGGYGGGGNAGNSGGGGGGGYSGGGGSYHNPTNGGGGGSFNSGTNQNNTVANTGNGYVVITEICDGLNPTASADTICQYGGLTLTATSSNGGNITWDLGATNGTEFYPDTTGWVTYTATSDNVNDCQAAVDVYVKPSATITLTATDELYMNDGTISLAISNGIFPFTYDWDNDGTGDYNDPQNLQGLGAGTYTVTVMQGNGCTTTASATVNSQVGIGEVELTSLRAFPNPTNGVTVVQYPGDFEYVVTNITGQVLYTGTATNEIEVSLEDMTNGTYLVKVITEQSVETISIVKQ